MKGLENGNFKSDQLNDKVMFRGMIVIFFFALINCNSNDNTAKTPSEFINNVIVTKSQYSQDSFEIVTSLYLKLKRHEASFNNPEYFDSTMIIIDTILYDSSLNRVAVFVITKNPIHRNSRAEYRFPYYYNANCYLGKRLTNEIETFDLRELGPFSIINFDNISEVRQAIQRNYFFELVTVLDENGNPVFEYNLNDRRFWHSTKGWEKVF